MASCLCLTEQPSLNTLNNHSWKHMSDRCMSFCKRPLYLRGVISWPGRWAKDEWLWPDNHDAYQQATKLLSSSDKKKHNSITITLWFDIFTKKCEGRKCKRRHLANGLQRLDSETKESDVKNGQGQVEITEMANAVLLVQATGAADKRLLARALKTIFTSQTWYIILP